MYSPSSHPGVFEPRTKEEWTDYVLAPEPPQLVLPSWQEYQAMDEMTRYRFNRDRDDQHSALVLAWTPRVAHFEEQIDLRLRCLSNGLEHQAAKTLAAGSSCDSMVGRGWLIQVLRGRLGALGGRRKRSGRAP